MTIQQISHFIAVAQHLHFGEAAKELYIAQPALSNSIAALEGELNVKLFARSSRRVTLTPAGKVFYENVQEVVEGLNRAIQKTRLAESGYAGTLDIGILGGLSKGDFPKVIYRFQKRFPNVAINLRQTNMKTLNRWLAHGEVDLGITRSVDLQARADELEWRVLYQDNFALFCRSDAPLAQAREVEFSNLAGEPFIILDQAVTPNVHRLILQLCQNRGFNPNILYTAPTLEIACMFVKAGLGISVLPYCGLRYGEGELTARELEGEDAVSDVVVAWRAQQLNPAIPGFLEEMGVDY